jgi:hypothetical protein
MFWFLNGIILVVLVLTLGRVAISLTSEDEQKKKFVAIELAWAAVLVVLLLYNFGVINF